MDMTPVSSSNVESIGYEDGVIEVHFHNGYAYRYPNCSEELFSQFLNASNDSFFIFCIFSTSPFLFYENKL